jgi:serine/threonine protein kinase
MPIQKNVLITDDGRACIADFGLTVIGDRTRSRLTTQNVAGSARWMAPEHVSDDLDIARKRPSGDVFAFGRLLLAVGSDLGASRLSDVEM